MSEFWETGLVSMSSTLPTSVVDSWLKLFWKELTHFKESLPFPLPVLSNLRKKSSLEALSVIVSYMSKAALASCMAYASNE